MWLFSSDASLDWETIEQYFLWQLIAATQHTSGTYYAYPTKTGILW